ncbi:GNAT family N-acetyltransferase [Gangjinia marincola]
MAELKDLDQLAPLFDQYRVFYKQSSHLEAARDFLEKRFQKNDSVVFMAEDGDQIVGFTQLYSSFSSVSLQRQYILNDLFVAETHRNQGIATALLEKAKEFCRLQKAKGLALETDHNNPAQYLYEKLGWKKDDRTFHYFWTSPQA